MRRRVIGRKRFAETAMSLDYGYKDVRMTFEGIKDFLVKHNGRVKQDFFVDQFRSELSNVSTKEVARQKCKDILRLLTTVEVKNGEKYIVLTTKDTNHFQSHFIPRKLKRWACTRKELKLARKASLLSAKSIEAPPTNQEIELDVPKRADEHAPSQPVNPFFPYAIPGEKFVPMLDIIHAKFKTKQNSSSVVDNKNASLLEDAKCDKSGSNCLKESPNINTSDVDASLNCDVEMDTRDDVQVDARLVEADTSIVEMVTLTLEEIVTLIAASDVVRYDYIDDSPCIDAVKNMSLTQEENCVLMYDDVTIESLDTSMLTDMKETAIVDDVLDDLTTDTSVLRISSDNTCVLRDNSFNEVNNDTAIFDCIKSGISEISDVKSDASLHRDTSLTTSVVKLFDIPKRINRMEDASITDDTVGNASIFSDIVESSSITSDTVESTSIISDTVENISLLSDTKDNPLTLDDKKEESSILDDTNEDISVLDDSKEEETRCKSRTEIHSKDKEWMLAASFGHLAALKELLQQYPDIIHKRDFVFGYTALHWAAKLGRSDIVDFSLMNGLDVNVKSHAGYTPLHIASNSGKDNIIVQLVENHADINCRDPRGKKPKDIVKDTVAYDVQARLGRFVSNCRSRVSIR